MRRRDQAAKLYSFENFNVYEYDGDRTFNGHDDDGFTAKRSEYFFIPKEC